MTPTRPVPLRRIRHVLAVLAPAIALLGFAPAAAGAQLAPVAAQQILHEAAAQQVTVPISKFAFQPASLEVHTGDTVTWVNQDAAPHNVTTTSAPAQFASDILNKGQSFSYTFSTPGTYSYMCSIHPNMVATVTAADHAAEPAAVPPPTEEAPQTTEAPDNGAVASAPSVPPASASATPGPAPGAAPAGAVPAPGVTGAAQPSRQLDPLLIVVGIAFGVATLCLLMISSQPAGIPAAASGAAAVGGGGSTGPATMTTAGSQHRATDSRHWGRGSVNPLLLRVLAAIGLAVDGYVHFDLASNYDAVGSVITQGALFRIQGAVAVLAALLIVLVGRSRVYQAVFLVAASALVPVVLYTYVDVGAIGPLPDMYEPVWYPDKTISAIAEAVAAIAAGQLALMRRSP